ncbi:MAG: hypothetical protein DRI26_01990 [Chloroflexi bacterium]|nr:MAG: hypothetical protein DRI26_01990 [Chloroflexota bacterium]
MWRGVWHPHSKTEVNKQGLIQFEEEIKELFLQRRIRAPVHLSGGNEDQLIEIFKEIKPEDWVLSTHRSHYHALLKGVPPELVKAEILAGRSMHLNFREYNFLTSAIVGGICPIAVGLAMGIKRRGENRKVWCFTGDCAAEMGIFEESRKYAKNFDLAVCFCIEDNDYSSNSPTRLIWGIKNDPPPEGKILTLDEWRSGKVLYYFYRRRWPHTGVGTWVQF